MTAATRRRVTPTGYRVLPADADRATWLAERRKGICSSDVAAILDVSPYRGPLHVWHDKRGNLPDDDAGEPALWGTLLEDVVAREWNRRNRSVIRRVGLVANVGAPWAMCTLDRLVTECPLGRPQRETCALEVKTRNAWVGGKWRAGVPDDVLAQVLWAIEVTGLNHMHVACLIGGNDYRQFVIRRDLALAADLLAACERFWTGHVLAGIAPPAGDMPGERLVDLYDRLHPDRSGVIALDMDGMGGALDAMRRYEEARLRARPHTTARETARAELVALLAGAELATIDDQLAYSYEISVRRNVDLERLAERHPEAYDDCVTESESRRLSIARPHRLTEAHLEDL